jgi:hypothetical protein
VRAEDIPSVAFSGMEKLDMQDVLSRTEKREEMKNAWWCFE